MRTQPKREQVYRALNATVTLFLLALLVARFVPGAPSAAQSAFANLTSGRSGASALTITGPGTTAAPSTITAYILGAVATPGVYTLPDGARVQDLVAAAGGARSDADMTQVDLAARLADGQEVYVPHAGETVPLTLGGKVDINVADATQLHNSLGISLTIARRIVAYRAAHGDFTAVSQLLLVPISRAEYDKIAPLVTV